MRSNDNVYGTKYLRGPGSGPFTPSSPLWTVLYFDNEMFLSKLIGKLQKIPTILRNLKNAWSAAVFKRFTYCWIGRCFNSELFSNFLILLKLMSCYNLNFVKGKWVSILSRA